MRFSIALYFFLFFQLISYSQSVLVPAGNNSLSPGPSLNWTIGEGITELRFDTKASISGEFQQSIITSGQSLSVSVSGITIYPNPASEFIVLEAEDYKNLSYSLYDSKARVLRNNKISDKITEIKLNDLLPGNYFLKIIKSDKELKTFKLIKSN